jgi:anti-anti-sigma factor
VLRGDAATLGASHVSEPPEAPSVAVWIGPAGRDGQYAAVVALTGAHDISTRREVERALAPIRGETMVDLTDCSFMDSSVLSAILQKARTLGVEGYGLEVRSRPGSAVARMLEIASIFDVVNIRATVSATDL